MGLKSNGSVGSLLLDIGSNECLGPWSGKGSGAQWNFIISVKYGKITASNGKIISSPNPSQPTALLQAWLEWSFEQGLLKLV